MAKTNWEQFWKLYKNLPTELQDAIFAEETGNAISEACEENGISENLSKVVDLVGQVLVGVLPPDEFEKALKEEGGLKAQTAKKAAIKIHRFIFYPVKSALEELYGNIKAGRPAPALKPAKTMEPDEPGTGQEEGESPKTKRPDVYRESY